MVDLDASLPPSTLPLSRLAGRPLPPLSPLTFPPNIHHHHTALTVIRPPLHHPPHLPVPSTSRPDGFQGQVKTPSGRGRLQGQVAGGRVRRAFTSRSRQSPLQVGWLSIVSRHSLVPFMRCLPVRCVGAQGRQKKGGSTLSSGLPPSGWLARFGTPRPSFLVRDQLLSLWRPYILTCISLLNLCRSASC